MENNPPMEVSLKIRKLPYDPTTPFFGYLPPKFENIFANFYHPYVYCSIVHIGQDMETTRTSFDRGLDKDVVQGCKGTLLSHKKR